MPGGSGPQPQAAAVGLAPGERQGGLPTTANEQVSQAGEIRLASVEGLRALTACGVVLAHGFIFTHTTGPVADTPANRFFYSVGTVAFLFFMLSGYMLYMPFVRRDYGAGRRIDVKSYFFNRVVRTLPIYYISVVVVLLLQEGGGTFEQWWRFLLFAQNSNPDVLLEVNGVVWTLVVEWQFYMLLPLLAFLLARLSGRSRARAAVLLGFLALVSYAVWAAKVKGTGEHGAPTWRYSLPANFFHVAMGMLIALLRVTWEEHPPSWLRGALKSRTLWIVASIPLWLYIWQTLQPIPWVLVANFLLLGACVLPLSEKPGLVSVIASRPLALLGVTTASIYLWHVPLMEALLAHTDIESFGTFMAVAGPLALAAGFVSYRLIEVPSLRLRRRWGETLAIQPTGRRLEGEP